MIEDAFFVKFQGKFYVRYVEISYNEWEEPPMISTYRGIPLWMDRVGRVYNRDKGSGKFFRYIKLGEFLNETT